MRTLQQRFQHWCLTLVAAVTVVQGLGLRDAVAAPWIIDTDMGADDWIAILDSAAQLNGDLKAITVVGNGLSHCPAGRDNASGLLQLINPTSEACGCSPIQSRPPTPAPTKGAANSLY